MVQNLLFHMRLWGDFWFLITLRIWCGLALIAYLGDYGLGDWIGIKSKRRSSQIQSSIFNHLKAFRKSEIPPCILFLRYIQPLVCSLNSTVFEIYFSNQNSLTKKKSMNLCINLTKEKQKLFFQLLFGFLSEWLTIFRPGSMTAFLCLNICMSWKVC